mmetsp:Transcript_8589/g.20211  ORF Transcript_8589/g.20211 Transcript_8589/m.20211 type:complete len:377 (-) Transcript_8589:37-1167(-)
MIGNRVLVVVIALALFKCITGLVVRAGDKEQVDEVHIEQNTELAASLALVQVVHEFHHKPEQHRTHSDVENMQVQEVVDVGSHANLRRSRSSLLVQDMENLTEPVWIFGSYHKSGCELAESIIHKFSGVGSVNWVGLSTKEHEVFSLDKFSNFFFEPNLSIIRLVPRYRLVHLIRDPSNIIVSAYRFHCKALERWLYVPIRKTVKTQRFREDLAILRNISMHIPEEHLSVLRHFAANVATGATLSSYYQSVPEEDGVLIEAYRSWPEIHLMSSNYAATLEDPDVVQVHMESILQDFDSTMHCMLSFLQLSRPLNVTEGMALLHPLDITRHPSHAGGGASHITSGRYNNSRLLEVLGGVEALRLAQKVMAVPAVSRC